MSTKTLMNETLVRSIYKFTVGKDTNLCYIVRMTCLTKISNRNHRDVWENFTDINNFSRKKIGSNRDLSNNGSKDAMK